GTSGSQRSPAVSSSTSFAQVAGAILGKQACGQNPDKDEAGGPVPPTPTTRLDQRKPRSPCPTRSLDGRVRGRDLYRVPALVIRPAPGALFARDSRASALIGIDLGSPCVRSSGE